MSSLCTEEGQKWAPRLYHPEEIRSSYSVHIDESIYEFKNGIKSALLVRMHTGSEKSQTHQPHARKSQPTFIPLTELGCGLIS